MAEVIVRDGTWTFDGERVRIVPGGERKIHNLRQALGELAVPLTALAGVTYEPARKGGRLRLRLRQGADPFLQVAGGKLADEADPYRLAIDQDSAGAAEYFVDEIRNDLLIAQVPPGESDRYLLAGPSVPLSATAGDGTVSFDGKRIHIEWTDWAEEVKKASGPREIALEDVVGVEWTPIVGWTNGFLRFRVTGASALLPKHDPNCISWGMRREGGTSSLLAAAVVARLPHPFGSLPAALAEGATGDKTHKSGDNHDALLQKLRELGELHRDGVLTEDEFTTAKQAILRRF
ncbi:DUF4429 domain-containing protein [Phytoactinopolyspora alkaliphila]|uniref:DUF4429 domain-containing protein n=1 Tax=Phytoactinopolyspora alkaliphila TaxID=1783498 RepID=A0A6N9YIX8_9ACTN|nr:DUF4429 domain-containing protein [Phytoactinopolyspora alkaliphila]NED94914.1 DUF4429 domain-containing protein [Phytoactinopolyspora alkaliphila]